MERRRAPGDRATVPAGRVALAAMLAGVAIGCGPGPRAPGSDSAAATITPDEILRTIEVLAHDSMRGRDTPSPELEGAARWIAAALRDSGLEPGAGGGSFLQRYPVPPPTEPAADGDRGTTSEAASAREESAPNVVGILPGSDARVAHEYVLFSAHMDHVGVGRPDAAGDSIYNGADDDASGTSVVMELAEAYASMDTGPRRSMIFLLVSGEEKGLWGSAHFAERPPVPLRNVVAGLNLDMVGRNWTDSIVVIGRDHSDLGRTLDRVSAAHPELGMEAIPDLWPEERFYYRSDHFNFARKGVPVLFFFNGTHDDYHRPSDEAGKIREEKTARIGRLVFHLGLEVANAEERPRWDPDSYGAIVEDADRAP